jgi:hypothetical protein
MTYGMSALGRFRTFWAHFDRTMVVYWSCEFLGRTDVGAVRQRDSCSEVSSEGIAVCQGNAFSFPDSRGSNPDWTEI